MHEVLQNAWISVVEMSAVADVSCNFESGLCDWSSVRELNHNGGALRADQVWRTHSQLLMHNVGPPWDRSSTDGGINAISVNHYTTRYNS